MSLYKRGNTWWIRFTAPSGQRVRCSAGTEDKKQAQEFHDELRVKYWRVDKLGERPEYAWQDAVVKWLKETSYKATHQQDVSNLRWLDRFLGDKLLSQVDRELVSQIGETKAAETSPSNANRYLALIRAILRRARDEWEWIDKISKVRLFRINNRRVSWLTQEQAALLLSLLPAHQNAMARFALATGLRQSNVSQLQWSQVDLHRRVAWVHPDQAKARKAIPVALNSEAMLVLKQMSGEHEKYVFTFRGNRIGQVNTKAWKNAVNKAGLEGFRWHDLRHTWASWHVQSGTPLYVLQEMGGWSSAEMVRRYAHLSAEHLSEYAENIVHDTKLAQCEMHKNLSLE